MIRIDSMLERLHAWHAGRRAPLAPAAPRTLAFEQLEPRTVFSAAPLELTFVVHGSAAASPPAPALFKVESFLSREHSAKPPSAPPVFHESMGEGEAAFGSVGQELAEGRLPGLAESSFTSISSFSVVQTTSLAPRPLPRPSPLSNFSGVPPLSPATLANALNEAAQEVVSTSDHSALLAALASGQHAVVPPLSTSAIRSESTPPRRVDPPQSIASEGGLIELNAAWDSAEHAPGKNLGLARLTARELGNHKPLSIRPRVALESSRSWQPSLNHRAAESLPRYTPTPLPPDTVPQQTRAHAEGGLVELPALPSHAFNSARRNAPLAFAAGTKLREIELDSGVGLYQAVELAAVPESPPYQAPALQEVAAIEPTTRGASILQGAWKAVKSLLPGVDE